MTAPHIVDPSGLLGDALAEASPDLMRSLLQTMINALLSADARIYFCDAASHWQRGSNENTNGLLRQYSPKSTDLSVHTARDLARVEFQLNKRPRIVLKDRTPASLFTALLASEDHRSLR